MNILKEVAKNNGVSVAEVERDIRLAIIMAMHCHNNEQKKTWEALFSNDKLPSPKKIIKVLAGEINH